VVAGAAVAREALAHPLGDLERRPDAVARALDELLERATQLEPGAAILAPRLQRASHGGGEGGRDIRTVLLDGRDAAVAQHAHPVDRVLPRHQHAPGQELPQHHRQREHVGAAIQLLPDGLLGRHVRELALHHARPGLLDRADRLGDAEVDQLDRAVVRGDQVGRRHVAVDDVERAPVTVAQLVGVVEPGARVGPDARHQHVRHALGLGMLDEVAGVDPVDVLHGDEVVLVHLSEVVDVDDVGVRELRGQARLVEEHPDEVLRIDEMRQDPLHGDHALEALRAALAREEHLRHAAASQSLDELVLTERDARQLRSPLGHGNTHARCVRM
jgi:hypothetical protein